MPQLSFSDQEAQALLTLASRIQLPPSPVAKTQIIDSLVTIGAASATTGTTIQILGNNINRAYAIIQNNTSVNISVSPGSGSSNGLVLVPMGWYEREFNVSSLGYYVTFLGNCAAGDYVCAVDASFVTE